ncbi:hypothetical protein [Pseudomaricurvus sp. HS19]|uniref:hypothetical protein n=1 Tax=Pseudomaricurvus sp. HS19 TaxID=2692626 RepID=UPI0013688196|nr:hypothetical protein [Pseudomaricurvus sp. HS19]MYM64278.1 hypothetical protein [Pseudomaricurvus sp. HS19]
MVLPGTPARFHHSHQTHLESLLKFLALISVLVAYFLYVAWKFNAATGFGLALLSWSFFVLCTPIADGGFIVAFPVRLLFNVRMATTQLVVWLVAVAINIVMLLMYRDTYALTFLTRLLEQILTQPLPYWSILLISALGTFLSIWFGDEMMDVTRHSHREKYHRHGFNYRLILVLGLGILTVAAYYNLLAGLDIQLPE